MKRVVDFGYFKALRMVCDKLGVGSMLKGASREAIPAPVSPPHFKTLYKYIP